MHLAAHEKNYLIVEHLMENGADPFAKDANGRRPSDLCIGESYLIKYFRLKEKQIIKKHLMNLKNNTSSTKKNNDKNLKAQTYKKKIFIEMREDNEANVGEEEEDLTISIIQNTLPKTKKNLESHQEYIFYTIIFSILLLDIFDQITK